VIVQYTRTWITNVVTSEQVSGQADSPTSPAYAVRGEVRGYVGGRQRAIGRAGTSGTWAFQLREMNAAAVAMLELWMSSGVTVFVRNHLGDSMYGTFFAIEPAPVKAAGPNDAAWSVSLEIRMVDVVEGV
jgi:hypothetical protein